MQEIGGEKTNGLMLVGIGASAGGIDALLRFFGVMPTDAGLAFAIVLHTTPGHDNRLAEVLQRSTGMPVVPVAEPTRIEANTVYCLPPDKQASLTGGQIRIDDSDLAANGHAPIDLFFRALGHAYRDKAIAVVLSGTGADGSLGLGRIREEGGVSIVQDPSEAEHATMPRSAIETGYVDFILPVAAIPEKLVSLKENAERIQLPPADTPPRAPDEDALRELLALLRARTRHDFANYKRSTLLRRIERRLQVTECEDIRAYLEHIRKNPEELQGLLRDLLISVTNFFRDPEAFRRLQSEVVPKLFAGKGGSDQIRVWIAGCASGEEAYSIAMLLAEHAAALSSPPALQVFATDIDENALAHGRQGVYPHTIAADVSPDRLKRFFVREGQYYRVKRELREMVLFAPHNILRDPPFSKLNLVSCRNLLIYINRNMQERILEIFHFALKPDGYLFLGSSESAEGMTDLFASVVKKHRIFKRSEDGSHGFKPAPPPPVAGEWAVRPTAFPPPPQLGPRAEGVTYGELHYRMLEALAPPSALVNAGYDIVHLSEHAGRYLRLSGGEPTRNILKVAHPDLRLELRSLLITAAQQSDVTSGRAVVNLEGTTHFVRIVVRPLAGPLQAHERAGDQTKPAFMLVVFEEADAAPAAEAAEEGVVSVAPAASALEPIVRQLETELERTRDQLRATVEEYETSTEELKASNEELQAMNEELRSASEELETGKEELQSVNEELTTLNTELREKVDEIGRSNSDLQNLMASTRIATIFLDRALRLKRYTPSAQELFNIIPGDLGRPLAHITHKLEYTWMVDDADRVLRDLHTVEREVSTVEGRHFLARLLPYRTTDDKINGVVLTFTDITERARAEEAMRVSEQRLQRMVNVPHVGVLTFDYAGSILHANDAFLEMVGYTREEFDAGKFTWRDFTPDDHVEASERIMEQLRETGRGGPYEKEYFRKDGSRVWLMFVGADLGDGTIVEYALDVSDRRRAEERLRDSETKLAADLAGMRRLYDLHARIATEADLKFVLDEILAAACDFTHTDRGCIQLLSEDRTQLEMFAWRGYTKESPFIKHFRHEGLKEGCDAARVEQKRIIVEDWAAAAPTVEDTEVVEIVRAEQIGASQSTPMVSRKGDTVGVLSTQFREPHRPTEDELRLIDLLAWTAADFVERHRAEEALRLSEERLRLVLESAVDYAIMLMDAGGRYTSWNPGAEKIFGFTEEEVIGRHAELIFTPEDRAAGVPQKELSAADREGRATDDRWHMRKDGSRVYVSGVMITLRNGGHRGYAKIARDLTTQEQTQEELSRAWGELDERVQLRTAELASANSALREEAAVRRRAERERLKLLRRIVSTQEEERRRISRELHDQLGQALTVLRLKLEGLKEAAGSRSKLRGRIGELVETARRIDTDVDFLAWELRPTALDDLGLIVALSNFAQEWSKHFGVRVNFHSASLGEVRLAPLIETTLYRIAQEALNNVAKHSGAASVDILLERRDDHVVLIIEDNGRGFDAEDAAVNDAGRGMGLVGMRERAALVGGTVEVESKPGGGTTVFVRTPVRFGPTEGLEDGDAQA